MTTTFLKINERKQAIKAHTGERVEVEVIAQYARHYYIEYDGRIITAVYNPFAKSLIFDESATAVADNIKMLLNEMY